MKVCVDPGHGMSNKTMGVFDPGCSHTEGGFQFREADIVLKYGLTLKDILRARQVDVFMTRDDNTIMRRSASAPGMPRAPDARSSYPFM